MVEPGTVSSPRPVASVAVPADAAFLPPAIGFVRSASRRLGLREADAGDLARAVEAVCRNVIEHAFGPGEDGKYEIRLLSRPGQVVVAVEDRGLPFDYVRLQRAGTADMLHRASADEVRFVNLGRDGNRVEIVRHLSHADVREQLSGDEHHEVANAPAVPEDVPLEVRTMRPEESFELSRCVYRSYGYSYDWDDIYYPERIKALQEGGLMRSCVAVKPEGEFVGHLAVRVEHPDAPVGEAGQAVVDPRFRGHQLFPRMKTFLAEQARARGMYGLYSEATAVHPYSQKGNLRLGARETGFLLGYIPASVSYREIGEDRAGRRGSVALFYLRTNDEPQRRIYPPDAYRDAVRRVVEHNALRRDIENIEEGGAAPETPLHSRVEVSVRTDHNLAFVRVEEPGADLAELVGRRLRELYLHRVDCVYVDLPLSHPATANSGQGLRDLGFFFGGVIPEAHPKGGDVLRLQYLNEVEVTTGDLQTASDFGRELLARIFDQKKAAEDQGGPA
jgi:serine/threonine-protein kinase RsbW